jgi:hypothetical protein
LHDGPRARRNTDIAEHLRLHQGIPNDVRPSPQSHRELAN